MRFKCAKCGEAFNVSVKPKFCPICGNDAPTKNLSEYMLSQIRDFEKLNKKISHLYDEIAPLKMKADRIAATLRTYKTRGLTDYRTKSPTLKDSMDKLKGGKVE